MISRSPAELADLERGCSGSVARIEVGPERLPPIVSRPCALAALPLR